MRLFLFISLFPLFLFSQENKVIREVYVIENSTVRLVGNSNITGYACNLVDLSNNDNLPIKSLRKGTLIEMENAVIHLKTNGFKCDNKAMTKDFLKALKSEAYPTIKIEFLSYQLNALVEEQHKQKNVKADILISIAGVDRKFTILLGQIKFKMDELTIKGSKKATMSDFEIAPPIALFGMVKVEDVIELEFDITFKLLY
jgi:hypothetical protein